MLGLSVSWGSQDTRKLALYWGQSEVERQEGRGGKGLVLSGSSIYEGRVIRTQCLYSLKAISLIPHPIVMVLGSRSLMR